MLPVSPFMPLKISLAARVVQLFAGQRKMLHGIALPGITEYQKMLH
jgi:hypothetical protein